MGQRDIGCKLKKGLMVLLLFAMAGPFAADCGFNIQAPNVPAAFELPPPADENASDASNRERPRIIGATSLGNTTVVVSFDKVMGDSATDASNFLIVTTNINPEAGYLGVVSAKFRDLDRTAVELTTLSQSPVQYDLAVVNVKDRIGIPMAPKQIAFDGRIDSDISFWGSGATNGGPDTDADGLTDAEEQVGWIVHITLADGTVVDRGTVSDPTIADTDNDGLNDLEEKLRNSDPRDGDTDDDSLSDFSELFTHFTSLVRQDTDADGIDDAREINVFRTSPLLADTDGDGFRDDVESLLATRNPLIADLPRPRIDVGELALRLDTRFSYTDTFNQSQTVSESSQVTLTESDEQTYSTSDAEVNKNVAEAGVEIGNSQSFGVTGANKNVGVKVTGNYEYTSETTSTVSQESKQASQQAYQDSLTTTAQVDQTQAVTRTIEDASVEVLVSVLNDGGTAFNISNLELTALIQDPFDRSRFLPVASLMAASAVDSGGDPTYALSPFGERGPFLFKSTEVFPSLVEDLMRSPRGLIFKAANFDVVDEAGRNLAFTTQDVNDRTAGLIIDYGNGVVEKYRIATNSTFNADAQPAGITLGYALNQVLGRVKNAPVDAISVGPNGCAETWAIGDDVQLADPICLPVAPGGLIIEPGPNELLESIPAGDDIRVGNTIMDGGDGCAHSRASRDDIQVIPGDCEVAGQTGVLILAGPNGVLDTLPGGDDERITIKGYGTTIIGRCDGNTTASIIDNGNGLVDTMAAGDDVQLIPVGNASAPGVIVIGAGPNGRIDTDPLGDDVRQGPGGSCNTGGDCPGGLCRDVEVLTRVGGVADVPAEKRFWTILSSKDIDPSVNFDDTPLQAGDVITLAYVQDKDDDGLFAREEFMYGSSDRRVNSDGCPLGDGQPGCDTNLFDFDTVRDFEEVRLGWPVQIEGRSSYFAYSSPLFPDSDLDGLFDDEERNVGTDPIKADTDEDGVSDRDELRGYDVLRQDGALIRRVPMYQSAIVKATTNGVAETLAVLDDVQVIAVGSPVTPGAVVIAPGPNGTIESKPTGNEVLEETRIILDGGNGLPETLAVNDDEQIGASPTSTRTITVTYLDFAPGGDTCDGADDGEFTFNFKIRKNATETLFTFLDSATVNRFATRNFNDAASPNSFSFDVGNSDTIAFTATVRENDSTCDAGTGNAIVEPLTGGNGFADTMVVGDDLEIVPVGTPVMPGDVIILPGMNGILDSMGGMPGVCEPVIIEPDLGGNGFADTSALGDDIQVIAVGNPANPGDVIISAGPNGMLESLATGDDEPIPGGGLCMTCHGGCSGDDVVSMAMAGDSCEDSACPGGSCDIGSDYLEWNAPPRGFTSLELVDDMIVEFTNGPNCFSTDSVRLRINVSTGATVTPGSVLIRAGNNGIIDSTPMGDDYFGTPHLKAFATDPLNRDTDADSLSDGVERNLTANPNDVSDASKFRDDDHDGLVNFVEETGWFIGCLVGSDLKCRNIDGEFIGVADEFNPPDDCVIVTSDKFDPDTDNDGLPDLLEKMLRSDPSDRDTDGDGLLDTDEFDPQSPFSVSLPLFRDFEDRCFEADLCTFMPADAPYGTSIVLADTDHDQLSDSFEIFDSWVIAPCIGGSQIPVEVFSRPTSADWDHDGVDDGAERQQATDPNNPDTDGDGKIDNPNGDPFFADPAPTGCGKLVTVSFQSYAVGADECETDPGDGEYTFRLTVNRPGSLGPITFAQDAADVDENETVMFGSGFTTTFLLLPGESFCISGAIHEVDPNDDEQWDFGCRAGTNFDYGVTAGSNLTIRPLPTENDDECMDDDVITFSIAISQA